MGSGRKRIDIQKVENLKYRRVTFTKRRQGIIKKANQLSTLTGCTVAALFFSPNAMNPFLYGDISLLEQAAAAATSVINHSTTPPVFTNSVQEYVADNYQVGDDQEPPQEHERLLLTNCQAGDDQERHQERLLLTNYDEQECWREAAIAGCSSEMLKPLRIVAPTYTTSDDEHCSYNNNNIGLQETAVQQLPAANIDDNLCVGEEAYLRQLMLHKQRLEAERQSLHDSLMKKTCQVGSSSSLSQTTNNKNDGSKSNDEALQQLLANLDDNWSTGQEEEELNYLTLKKLRLEAIKQSLLDKLTAHSPGFS